MISSSNPKSISPLLSSYPFPIRMIYFRCLQTPLSFGGYDLLYP
ncbi:hypothetical protein RchiOBHm_Chr4g0412401 [Rosa chinensis]|uniref:Uncharacterized protein n=1 Tax=Rosa chinensis TaxID=74649 RepID=A0A2P6QVU5_ROSCH|nr:hypothetical protein RchiOBHm_Chr4g0412401 [Rosa chinensis]